MVFSGEWRAYVRASVIVTTSGECRDVKGSHGRTVGSAEAHVHPAQWRHAIYAIFECDHEFHAKLPGLSAVVSDPPP
jgi:hypothetical protein